MSIRTGKLSVVIPVYQNEATLVVLAEKLLALESTVPEVELVFVDDGSSDGSYDQLVNLRARFSNRVVLIRFSKNFGQAWAIHAGIQGAKGDCIGIISADLQDPPELLRQMFAMWQEGTDFVLGERIKRNDGFIRDRISAFYWQLVNRFALPGYPVGGYDYCLIDRKVADLVKGIFETNTSIFSLIFYLGFCPKKIPYERAERKEGTSQYNLSKKLKLFADIFIGFSYTPIRFISMGSLAVSLISFVYGLWTIGAYFFYEQKISGWTTLVVLVSCFGGLILLTLGIIGEYLWRVLDSVRKRPVYVISSVARGES